MKITINELAWRYNNINDVEVCTSTTIDVTLAYPVTDDLPRAIFHGSIVVPARVCDAKDAELLVKQIILS